MKKLTLFCILCLTQVLVLNNIHLFNCATPLLYVFFILTMPYNYPKWGILLWSFTLGITTDTFTNTPGVAAASLTVIGAIQPYLLTLFIQRDERNEQTSVIPAMNTIGAMKYTFYTIIMVLVYTIIYFTLETLCFFNWQHWLECILGSTVITTTLILTLESLRKK
ncbi:rod shape-determining protein MreD [Xylanibacter muris]|nr:rod shape-determining protein MreD [Xylanibacter muris]